MVVFEDAKSVQMNDKVVVSGKEYRVTGVNDINNYGIVCDVSLEEVL